MDDMEIDSNDIDIPDNLSTTSSLSLDEEYLSSLPLSIGNTPCWLVKLPKFLIDSWKLQEDGTQIAKLRFEQRGEEKRHFIEGFDDLIPTSYAVDVLSTPNDTHVVQESIQFPGSANYVIGQINHSARLRPLQDDRYKHLIKQRELQANDKSIRVARELKQDDVVDLVAVRQGHIKDSTYDTRKAAREKLLNTQENRLEDQELLRSLFTLFGKRKYWGMKALLEETKQTQAHLRPILNQIADIEKGGTYSGTYRLKPEFTLEDEEEEEEEGSEIDPDADEF